MFVWRSFLVIIGSSSLGVIISPFFLGLMFGAWQDVDIFPFVPNPPGLF